MSKRSKTKSLKDSTVLSRPAVKTIQSDATPLKLPKGTQPAAQAIETKLLRPEEAPPAAKANGTKLMRSKGAAPTVQAIETKLMSPKGVPIAANTLTPKISDPLAAVVATPEKLAKDSGQSLPSKAVIAETASEPPLPSELAVSATPWDYSAKLFEIGQANTLCAIISQRYGAARTLQDILAVTSDLYKEQGRLFKKHAEDVIDMMSSQ